MISEKCYSQKKFSQKRGFVQTPRKVKCSDKWQVLFNFGKCKFLHTGHGNLDVNHKMGDTVLGTTVKENDLGKLI